MFFFIRILIICLLIHPCWLFATPGVKISDPQLVLTIADKHCTVMQGGSSDCEEPPLSDQSTEKLDQMHGDQVLRHFLDIIFENASCRCGGNTGCTRGCRLASYLNEEKDSTVRRCIGRKSIRKSRSKCTQHTTGAIMAVIHDFLTDYCKSTEDRILWASMSYQQCDGNFNKDVKNNNISICRHGFKFPHAFLYAQSGWTEHSYV